MKHLVFSSLLFLFRFLPIFILVYFAVPKRFRNLILFTGSLFFYGWGEPVFISLLLFSTLADYSHGLLIEHFKRKGEQKKARMAVCSSAIINLSLLGFFKYTDFLIGSLNQVSGLELPLLKLALPIGISFYTFQTMSYTIDVYRGVAKAQKNIIDFGAYVSMFPQLVAGPIVQYHTIAEELNMRSETVERFAKGVKVFIVGLGKKVLLANAMGSLWDQIHLVPVNEQTVPMLWLGILAYGLQIYFDFSGYSDMAVGMGLMFGFTFRENFRYPYMSKSITEFWRRWHISLGTWFKDYVYVPLGGNKKGIKRQIINIMIVWFLTGIWHGAGWNFLLWGLYFGGWLLLEKFCLKAYLERLPAVFQHAYALLIVFMGWVFFAHDNLSEGLLYANRMFGVGGAGWSLAGRTGYLLSTAAPQVLVCILGATSIPKKLFLKWKQQAKTAGEVWTILSGLGIMVLITAYLVDASYNPFLYFRF